MKNNVVMSRAHSCLYILEDLGLNINIILNLSLTFLEEQRLQKAMARLTIMVKLVFVTEMKPDTGQVTFCEH